MGGGGENLGVNMLRLKLHRQHTAAWQKASNAGVGGEETGVR